MKLFGDINKFRDAHTPCFYDLIGTYFRFNNVYFL